MSYQPLDLPARQAPSTHAVHIPNNACHARQPRTPTGYDAHILVRVLARLSLPVRLVVQVRHRRAQVCKVYNSVYDHVRCGGPQLRLHVALIAMDLDRSAMGGDMVTAMR